MVSSNNKKKLLAKNQNLDRAPLMRALVFTIFATVHFKFFICVIFHKFVFINYWSILSTCFTFDSSIRFLERNAVAVFWINICFMFIPNDHPVKGQCKGFSIIC